MRLRSISVWLCIVASSIAVPSSISAGVIVGYSLSSPQVYDIYSAGYAPNPTAPVRNTSASFVGTGLNLTGIGFVNPNTDRMITMISPRHFVMAAHAGPPTSTVYFVNSANQVRAYTIQATQTLTTGTFNGANVNQASDLLVGRLTAPIPASDGIGFYPIAFDSTANYAAAQPPTNTFVGRQLTTAGTNLNDLANYTSSSHIGFNNVTAGPTLQGGSNVTFSYDFNPATPGEFHSVVGDSGGPSFLRLNGGLALLGVHTDLLADNTSVDTFLPYYVSQLNAFMAQDTSGYQVTLAPAPEPSSLLLLSPLAALVYRRLRPRTRA